MNPYETPPEVSDAKIPVTEQLRFVREFILEVVMILGYVLSAGFFSFIAYQMHDHSGLFYLVAALAGFSFGFLYGRTFSCLKKSK